MADHFRMPDQVDIAWIRTGDRELASKVQQELAEGGDFFKVMIPRFGAGVEMNKGPINELSPLLQKIVVELAPGQVSPAVENEGEIIFVKLIRRHQGQPIPLAQLSLKLRQQLKEKRTVEIKREILEKLRNRSSIKVRNRVWQKVQKRLLAESAGSGKN